MITTNAAINMNSMFSNCTSLQIAPLMNTSAVTDMNSMFYGCTALKKIPALNATSITSSSGISNAFFNCLSLFSLEITGIKYSFNLSGCGKLSATELNKIYTNLPTITGQTLTVTNNIGTTSDNPAIATAKGWTVTG
jgi:hypothetical protein